MVDTCLNFCHGDFMIIMIRYTGNPLSEYDALPFPKDVKDFFLKSTHKGIKSPQFMAGTALENPVMEHWLRIFHGAQMILL